MLVDVPRQARVCGEEVFAPVVNLFRVPDFATGLAEINDSQFGLQCGVFTNDLERTLQLLRRDLKDAGFAATAQLFSALHKSGVDEAREALTAMLEGAGAAASESAG